jgi:hypothetical protein
LHQLRVVLNPLRIIGNARDGTNLLALRGIEMPHTLSALIRIDLVDFRAHEDGFVWALRLADIAVDALIGNHECHIGFLMNNANALF